MAGRVRSPRTTRRGLSNRVPAVAQRPAAMRGLPWPGAAAATGFRGSSGGDEGAASPVGAPSPISGLQPPRQSRPRGPTSFAGARAASAASGLSCVPRACRLSKSARAVYSSHRL